MLSELRTQNFKKIGTKNFEFGAGLNVLRGPNWAGKSSTLNSIKFALQGIQGIPGSKDDVQTWDSTGKCDVGIEIGDHRITRSLADCNIYAKGGEGKPVATGHTACNSYLDDLFGISVANYNMLHFSDQGETAGLLTIGAAELQKMVEVIADVTIIDKVIKLANTDVTMFKGRLEGATLIDTKEMKAELKASEDRKAYVLLQIEALDNAIVSNKMAAKTINDDLNIKVSELAKIQMATENKQAEELKLEAALTAIRMLADAVKEVPEPATAYTAQITELSNEIPHRKSKLALGIKNAERLVVLNEWLKVNAGPALDTENKWKVEIELLKAEVEGLVELKSTEEAKRNSITEKMAVIMGALDNSVCLTCKRPFDGADNHKEQQEAELKELSGQQATMSLNLEDCQDHLNDARRALADVENNPPVNVNVEQTIANFKAEVDALIALDLASDSDLRAAAVDIKRMEVELSDLTSKKYTADAEVARYNNAKKDYDKAVADRTAAELAIAEYKKVECDTTDKAAAIVKLEKSHSDLILTINTDNASVTPMKTVELPMIERNIAASNNTIEAADTSNIKLRRDRTDQANAKALVSYLRDSRSRFLKSIWDRILSYASTFCKTCTSDEIEGIIRDPKGKFRFLENGVDRSVTCASGAQKAFMGVGVRLGLAKALYGSSSFMVLDEPSSDMSEENSARLVSTLMGTGMQIIYSTHSDLEELSAGNVIDLGSMQ